MKKSTRTTVKQLAEEANLDLDLTLLLLWDGGFSEVTDDSHSFSGGRLNRAKVLLGVATKSQIVSIAYWQRELSMSADEISDLLKGLNLVISPRAKTLPSGAIKKLKSYRQNIQLTPTVEKFRSSHLSIEPIAPFQPFVWRVVGKERPVEPLTAEDVLAIQNALVIDFANQSEPIDPPGLRNRDLLESAIYRQHTSFNEIPKYSSVEMVAAALLHSLVFNHCFYNGNKRTALVSMLVLLDRNDITLTCDQDQLFKFILEVALHRVVDVNIAPHHTADSEIINIAEWIRSNSRHVARGERPLQFRKFRAALHKYGCRLLLSDRSQVKISRDIKMGFFRKDKILTTYVGYRNEGMEVDRAIITRVRSDLRLTEEHGIDSAMFYGDVPGVTDEFITTYRKTLKRLAKL